MPTVQSLAIATLAAVAAFAATPVVVPAGGSALAQQSQGEGASLDVPDETIDAFASAFLRVQEIASKWQSQLNDAETAEQQQKIREQANNELVAAVEGEGISVQEYNEISAAASADPELKDRIGEAIQDAQANQ